MRAIKEIATATEITAVLLVWSFSGTAPPVVVVDFFG
jgi:hypothetical protein